MSQQPHSKRLCTSLHVWGPGTATSRQAVASQRHKSTPAVRYDADGEEKQAAHRQHWCPTADASIDDATVRRDCCPRYCQSWWRAANADAEAADPSVA